MYGVVLPAGGLGRRMGADLPKQLVPIAGKPVWRHCADLFLAHSEIAEVVLVCPSEWRDQFEAQIAGLKTRVGRPVKLVDGGPERWLSVRAGIRALSSDIRWVLVHDVARPFLSREILDGVLRQVCSGACLVAKPCTDTVKLVHDGVVVETIDRNRVWLAQTPQAAEVTVLQDLYVRMGDVPGWIPTDEASILEHFGIAVAVVAGDDRNDKLTHPGDWARFQALGETHGGA